MVHPHTIGGLILIYSKPQAMLYRRMPESNILHARRGTICSPIFRKRREHPQGDRGTARQIARRTMVTPAPPSSGCARL